MALGYTLTMREVLAYYGEERRDVAQALSRAARGRRVQLTDWPDGLDVTRGRLVEVEDPQAVAEIIRSHLATAMPDHLPDEAPPRYPALHATVGRDIVLEVDVKHDQREAFARGRRILDLLERYEAPCRIKFSGNSSPHVLIPSEAYQSLLPEGQRGSAFRRLHAWLVEHSGAGVDGSFNQELHCLRLPYSLNERTGLVSLPLRPEEYDGFELEMAEAHRVQVADWWFETEDLLARREGMLRLLREALGKDAP